MSEYIYINGMTPAMVAEAVAQARSEIATMTDAEVMQWSKQWTDLAVQAPWNPMANELGMLYATEMHARMTKATVEVVAEEIIAEVKGFEQMSVEELREYAETVQAEYDADELSGPSGRQIVRDAWDRLTIAEAKMDDTYPVKIYTAAEVATIEATAGVRK